MLLPLILAAAVGSVAPIDPSGFSDSAHHWRNINQPERIMQAEPDQPAYAPTQIREIADNLLLFQRENGGWPKDYDMLAMLTEAQKKLIRDTRANPDTSYDNHTTHPQVEYLAKAFVATGVPMYRDACRVIEFRFGDPNLGPDHIARELHISTRTLSRLFAAHNETVMRRVFDVRVRHAMKRLAAPAIHRSITAIAFACGFNDSSHFGRVFAARVHRTPSEWQRQNRHNP